VSIEFGWIVPGIKNGFLENGYIGSCDVSLLGSWSGRCCEGVVWNCSWPRSSIQLRHQNWFLSGLYSA